MLNKITNSNLPLHTGVVCALSSIAIFISSIQVHAINQLALHLLKILRNAPSNLVIKANIAVITKMHMGAEALVPLTPYFLLASKVLLIAAAIFIALHFAQKGVRALATV